MNKLFKIVGWVLGLVGLFLGIFCLMKGNADNEGPVNSLLSYTYVLFFAAIAIWILLAVFIALKNDPKSLLKGLLFIVIGVIVVGIAYMLAGGQPVETMKEEIAPGTLKLTDTMLTLTYILGGAAIVAIIFGAIKGAINK